MLELNPEAFSLSSSIDVLAFATMPCWSSMARLEPLHAMPFRAKIEESAFRIILCVAAEDLFLISAAIALSFSTKFSAMFTVSSTGGCW